MSSTEADPTRVRQACPADEEELFALAVNLHAENGIYALCEEKVRFELQRAIRREESIIGVVGKDRVEGAAWLAFSQDWYTEDYGILERFVHVLPEYRKSTNAKDLIAWTDAVRRECNLPLHIGILSNERTEAKIRFYRKSFGEPAGAFFLVGAETGRAH